MQSSTKSIIEINELSSIRQRHAGEKIVFCIGTFDLTHVGHILFFEDCKKYGDVLVVMVGTDFNVRNYKGENRPFLNQHTRLKTVSSLKPVDYALLDLEAPDGDVNAIIARVFRELRPDFYVVNDDASELSRRRKMAEGTTTRVVVLPRTCPPEFENISTSKIAEIIRREKKGP
jgi:cytidyltransferase-like protein